MRGRSCPKAWVSLVPERVCPKVGANRHKSPSSSSDEGDGKRGTNAQNPPRLSRGSLQIMVPGEAVLPVVREMAEAGIHNAIVLTAGFAEQDGGGRLRHQELQRLALDHGI